jgi:hypothetical protein
LFTDTLNRNGCGWNAFRDAYKAVAEQLENGTYTSQDQHTHEGSINNLCLAEINEKNEQSILVRLIIILKKDCSEVILNSLFYVFI